MTESFLFTHSDGDRKWGLSTQIQIQITDGCKLMIFYSQSVKKHLFFQSRCIALEKKVCVCVYSIRILRWLFLVVCVVLHEWGSLFVLKKKKKNLDYHSNRMSTQNKIMCPAAGGQWLLQMVFSNPIFQLSQRCSRYCFYPGRTCYTQK